MLNSPRTGLIAAAAIVTLLITNLASAQSSQGGLRGVVKDAQGVIPGVSVTLLNEANGTSRDTITNASGEYSFPAVEPATYTVKVSVQGFRSFERQGVRISTQQFVGLDIQLEVGTLAETITVTIKNFGSTPQFSVPVSYKVNGIQ